jgi:Zn-dependent protease with chaperone function
LDEVELSAVIAHEIGHLWIYTHHPYLQTEALANRIALKLVGRQALASAYRKLWDRTGEPGDLDAFLGK